MASLFLILIYSISRCKKEEKQLEFKANVQERIITQGEMIKIIPEISGINTRNDDYIFEVEYEIESKFYGTKNKIRQKIRWNQKIDNLLLTEEMKKCDHVVFRLISVSWEDLTGIYKIKKYEEIFQIDIRGSFHGKILLLLISRALNERSTMAQVGD